MKDAKINQNLNSNSFLSIEENIIKREKLHCYNYKKLLF